AKQLTQDARHALQAAVPHYPLRHYCSALDGECRSVGGCHAGFVAKDLRMTLDIPLGTLAGRRGDEPEALKPAQLLNDGFSHTAARPTRTSMTTSATVSANAASGTRIDRLKRNMASSHRGCRNVVLVDVVLFNCSEGE